MMSSPCSHGAITSCAIRFLPLFSSLYFSLFLFHSSLQCRPLDEAEEEWKSSCRKAPAQEEVWFFKPHLRPVPVLLWCNLEHTLRSLVSSEKFHSSLPPPVAVTHPHPYTHTYTHTHTHTGSIVIWTGDSLCKEVLDLDVCEREKEREKERRKREKRLECDLPLQKCSFTMLLQCVQVWTFEISPLTHSLHVSY